MRERAGLGLTQRVAFSGRPASRQPLKFSRATPKTELALLGALQPTSKLGEMFVYWNFLAAARVRRGARFSEFAWFDREPGTTLS